MKRDKIIFLTEKNPRSKKDWSGIPYFMFKALEDIYDVEYVRGPDLKIIRRILFYAGKGLQKITGLKYVFDYGSTMAWFYGAYYSRILSNKRDVKFIIVPAGLTEISKVRTSFPLVSVGDCSTLQLFDYYPALKSVSAHSKADIERVERSALSRCSRIIFSSSWAADFVSSRYNTQAFVIPFGANIRTQAAAKGSRTWDVCRMLLVGVDWDRKGGSTALEILRSLTTRKIPCTLTVVGMKPRNEASLPPNITFTSIDKDSKAGEKMYNELLNSSDLLLLPTIADCTPIVIAEAFSAGLPVFATRTGGIPSMVEDGVTGFLFEPGDSQAYVNAIFNAWEQPESMAKMSQNCLSASRERFNWEQWAAGIQNLCASL